MFFFSPNFLVSSMYGGWTLLAVGALISIDHPKSKMGAGRGLLLLLVPLAWAANEVYNLPNQELTIGSNLIVPLEQKVWFQIIDGAPCDAHTAETLRSSIVRVPDPVGPMVFNFTSVLPNINMRLCVFGYEEIFEIETEVVSVLPSNSNTMTAPAEKEATFDFSQCDGGSGSFTIHMDKKDVTKVVGLIPKGKVGVRVSLVAENDLDISLYDTGRNYSESSYKAIVGWCKTPCPIGLLSGATRNTILYRDVAVTYSGYNGNAQGKGNEYIILDGPTPDELVFAVYSFRTGKAHVTYSWTGSVTPCCLGVEPCTGSFSAYVGTKEVKPLGEIAVRKENVRVELEAREDIDIQLWDKVDNVPVVAYCYSSDPTCSKQTLGNKGSAEQGLYKGLVYKYSGYNGKQTPETKGYEHIEVEGITNVPLQMSILGYKSGYANVTYSYTEPALDADGCSRGQEFDQELQSCVSIHCAANPCAANERCVPSVNQCIVNPCPQYTCSPVPSNCADDSAWISVNEVTCASFKTVEMCWKYGQEAAADGTTANNACCVCKS